MFRKNKKIYCTGKFKCNNYTGESIQTYTKLHHGILHTCLGVFGMDNNYNNLG